MRFSNNYIYAIAFLIACNNSDRTSSYDFLNEVNGTPEKIISIVYETYDSLGYLVKSIPKNKSVTFFNSDGKVLRSEYYNFLEDNGAFELSSIIVNKYAKNGKLENETTYKPNGEIDYIFDAKRWNRDGMPTLEVRVKGSSVDSLLTEYTEEEIRKISFFKGDTVDISIRNYKNRKMVSEELIYPGYDEIRYRWKYYYEGTDKDSENWLNRRIVELNPKGETTLEEREIKMSKF